LPGPRSFSRSASYGALQFQLVQQYLPIIDSNGVRSQNDPLSRSSATWKRPARNWAAQLDSYRKGSAPQVFNLLSYLWLFVQSIVAFALINYALYRGDPSAFVYTTTPQLFDFFHYAINLILNSSVTSPEASSQVAIALGDLVRLSGPVVLVTILATFVLSTRQSRQDEQMKESIRRIKDRSRQFEVEFESQYEVSITEAMDRLKQVPGALVGIAADTSGFRGAVNGGSVGLSPEAPFAPSTTPPRTMTAGDGKA
jgi:hypothetical protein